MQIIKKISWIKKALKQPDCKPLSRVLREYLHYKLTKPELAEQYFNKFLFRKSVINPSNFIVTHEMAKKIWYYSDMRFKSILTNKLITERFFNFNNLPVIKNVAHNVNYWFETEGESLIVNNVEEFFSFLIGLKEKGKWTGQYLIIKKKEGSYGGRNIFKISYDDVQNKTPVVNSLFNQIVGSGFLFQNLIIQHSELNKITPYSLNSLRIDTFINRNGTPNILNATLRCSKNNSFVDNITSGGLFVGIDMETGKLSDEAFSHFEKDTGEIYSSHPLTGQVFSGFQIPYFMESKELAKTAAKLLPQAKVIGWDIGIQENGPVLIEGNYFNSFYLFELSQNGFATNPVFQELLYEIDLFYNKKENNLKKMIEKNPLFV